MNEELSTLSWTIVFIMRIISGAIGMYVGIFFMNVWKELKQPPHIRFPFIMMSIANFGIFLVYSMAILQIDGFGGVSNTGRVVQILILILQVMPVVLAKHMRKM